MNTPESALSETMSMIFMAILVIVAATLIIASMTGVISHLIQKPALLSAQVTQYDSGTYHTIAVFHQQGNAVNLNGTSQTGGSSIVSLTLDTGGLSYPVSPKVPALGKNQWGPGDTLYIYKTGSGVYEYTDDPSGITGSLQPGSTYTVKILDNKVNVIINALPVTIR